jgi:hypothetical protein
MIRCPQCASYTAIESTALDAAGEAHHAALAAIRDGERGGSVSSPDRWWGGWGSDAFHWTAPDPTHGRGPA